MHCTLGSHQGGNLEEQAEFVKEDAFPKEGKGGIGQAHVIYPVHLLYLVIYYLFP